MSNTIIIPGRIGKDAETKQVGDTTVTKFSVADDNHVKGEKVTTWWECSMWGPRGEKLAQYLTKGSAVTVVGTASFRQYEKDGQSRVSAECRVGEITLLGKGEAGTGQQRQASAKPSPAPLKVSPDDVPFDDDIPF